MKKGVIFGLVLIIFTLSSCAGKSNSELSSKRLDFLVETDKLFIESATESLKTTQIVVDSINLYKEHRLKSTVLENIERTIKIQSEYIDLVQGADVPELQNYKEYLLGVLRAQKSFSEKCYESINVDRIDDIKQALDSYTDSEYKNEDLLKKRQEDFTLVGIDPNTLEPE